MSRIAFKYIALDQQGAQAGGTLHAVDRQDAYRQIIASGLRPLNIRQRSRGIRFSRRKCISLKEISHFTEQFAVLMEARIPIVEGLRSIAAQESNEQLQRIIDDVADNVSAGSTVTEALSPHRNHFGDVYVETVRAAEASGNLIEVLNHLATMLDREYDMRKNVRGALLYPLCVVVTLISAVTFLMIVVIPRFATMFEQRNIPLPLPTQIVVTASDGIRAFWLPLLIASIALIWMTLKAWRHPSMRRRMDTWLHMIPLMRELLRGIAVSRFSHVFGLSLRSGIGLIEALDMSGNASGRPLLQSDIRKMVSQVNEGGRLADVLIACTYLPPFTRRMLAAGEEAAEMSRMCEIVARHYDREVTHMAKDLTTVLEPILIVMLAAVVLMIALAIFLPMWNMAALIG